VIEFRDKEERDAWVAFAAGLCGGGTNGTVQWATRFADELVEEFRKRRGSGRVPCDRGRVNCDGRHQITQWDPVGLCRLADGSPIFPEPK
jgi:hypothetical protein